MLKKTPGLRQITSADSFGSTDSNFGPTPWERGGRRFWWPDPQTRRIQTEGFQIKPFRKDFRPTSNVNHRKLRHHPRPSGRTGVGGGQHPLSVICRQMFPLQRGEGPERHTHSPLPPPRGGGGVPAPTLKRSTVKPPSEPRGIGRGVVGGLPAVPGHRDAHGV